MRAAVERGVKLGLVERTLPFRHHDGRDRIADEIRLRQPLRHQPVDTENERDAGHRNDLMRRKGRCKDNEYRAGDARRSF